MNLSVDPNAHRFSIPEAARILAVCKGDRMTASHMTDEIGASVGARTILKAAVSGLGSAALSEPGGQRSSLRLLRPEMLELPVGSRQQGKTVFAAVY
jgi:hypothetical protein